MLPPGRPLVHVGCDQPSGSADSSDLPGPTPHAAPGPLQRPDRAVRIDGRNDLNRVETFAVKAILSAEARTRPDKELNCEWGVSMTGTAQVRGAWFGVRLLAVMALASGLTVATGAMDQPAGASTGSPVVFGDICSCSGAEASAIAPTSDVLQAWASWTNAHGGIAGHDVQVVVKDDALNPATSLADVQDLVTQNHIVGLFDNSDEDPSWATYIEQQKVPVFGNTDTPAGQDNPDFYPPGTTNRNLVVAEAVSLKRAHVKKLADLYCVEDPVCASSVPPLEAALKKEGYGTQIVYKSGDRVTAPNYTGQCLAAKQAGATAVTVGDAAEIVTKVAMNCAQQGYDPIELGVDGTVSSSWLPIPSMQGNIDPQPDLPWFIHNAATKTMFTALDKSRALRPDKSRFRRDIHNCLGRRRGGTGGG